MQKQLEKGIFEVEKMKQQEQEEKRKAVDAVENQVSLLHTFIQVNLRNGSVFYVVVTFCLFMSVPLDFFFVCSITDRHNLPEMSHLLLLVHVQDSF